MATRKTRAPKRAGAAKGGRGMAKKSKPAQARKKARPAAKTTGRKPAAKSTRRPAKAAKKAPARARKAVKTAKPAKTAVRKKAPRKTAARKTAVRKAPARKTEAKRAPAKKAAPPAAEPKPAVKAAAPPAAEPKPVAKAAAVKTAKEPRAVPRKAPRAPEPALQEGTAVAAPVAVEPVAEVSPAAEAEPARPGLPAIRPYRGTQGGRPAKGKGRPKKRTRNRYSKLFAEFETRPATPERKKKRRSLDEEEEETTISVLRERPKLQIESPEQIRAGVLKKYLATGQPSCPVGCGGIAEVVRVGTLEDGTGEVWIECLSCAQRERFLVPKATPAERTSAQQAMEEAGEAVCPRHGRPVQLRRRGRDLVCPECGVLYPES